MTVVHFFQLGLALQAGRDPDQRFANELYRRYFSQFVGYAMAKGLRSRSDAEIVVIRVLENFYERVATGRFEIIADSKITHYLYRALSGAVQSWFRQGKNRPAPLADYDPVAASALDASLVEDLREMLELLPADQRDLIRLKFFDRYTLQQISALRGVKLSTVHGRLNKAIANLGELLGHD